MLGELMLFHGLEVENYYSVYFMLKLSSDKIFHHWKILMLKLQVHWVTLRRRSSVYYVSLIVLFLNIASSYLLQLCYQVMVGYMVTIMETHDSMDNNLGYLIEINCNNHSTITLAFASRLELEASHEF